MSPYLFLRSRATSAKTLMNFEKALLGVDLHQVDAELALEDLLDLLGLVEAHAAVVDEHAD